MTNNKAADSETIPTGEIDQRDLDHVSGGVVASPLMIETEETPFALDKNVLRSVSSPEPARHGVRCMLRHPVAQRSCGGRVCRACSTGRHCRINKIANRDSRRYRRTSG